MDKEINETYNTIIILRKHTRNEISNIKRTFVILKGYSGVFKNFIRK